MNAKSSETAVSPKGERHRLTVLFADLVGSTVLGREMESEYFSELLGKLRAIWHRAAAKHGGRVIRTQGDGVLAVFGYPRSGEDDGRRAAEAALDIHEWVGQVQHDGLLPARLPLRMHSGIHAGTLLLSPGDIEWGRFDLIGDVVNTAAHLSQHRQSDDLGDTAAAAVGPDPVAHPRVLREDRGGGACSRRGQGRADPARDRRSGPLRRFRPGSGWQ